MSKKQKIILFSLGGIGVLFAGILVFIMGRYQTKAEVRIESNVESEVYLDGKLIGVTPQTYETANRKLILQLVPKDNKNVYLPYETALSLTPQTKTIVRHNFSASISGTTTQIMSFTPESQNASPMTIITNPESAYVFVNNEYVGTSPLRIDKPASTYSVQIMHTGFQSMQVTLKNSLNFNLVAYLDLALQTPASNLTAKAQNSDESDTSAVVRVIKTPTGYVRVHETPSESAQEISRAFVGREYSFEGYSPLKDWIEVNLNASQSGWILTRYATVSGTIR